MHHGLSSLFARMNASDDSKLRWDRMVECRIDACAGSDCCAGGRKRARRCSNSGCFGGVKSFL
eukprot:364970-Chlamydomonas_euryale.AAC.4